MPTTSCRVEVHATHAVVSPVGELDFATAPVLRDAALQAARARVPLVVFDLGGTTFMDSTAIGIVVGLHRRLRTEQGGRVVIANPTRLPGKALQLLGIGRIIEVVDGVRPEEWAARQGVHAL